jgi:lipid-binding SYLF domain-containing protein
VLRPDADDNRELYGRAVNPRDVLLDRSVSRVAATEPLMRELEH